MEPLLALLIYTLIAVLVLAIIWYVIVWLGLPEPMPKIFIAILALIFLILIIRTLGLM